MKLSVLILAKNEEDNIKECIESVLFADEIIVIDDYSTDSTAEIAVFYMDIQLDSSGKEAYSKDIKIPPGKVLIPFSRHIHPMPFGFSSKTMN